MGAPTLVTVVGVPVVLLLLGTLLVLGVLHEFGHVVVGHLLGFRLRRVGVSRWLIARDRSVRRAPRRSGLPFLSVYMEPSTPDQLRLRHSLMIAAGALVNIVISGALGVVLWRVRMGETILYLLLWLAVISGAMALINLIPRRRGAYVNGVFPNDGAWLLEWTFRPDVAASRVALALVYERAMLGARPRDMPEVWCQLALRNHEPVLSLFATDLAYKRSLEWGRIDEAEHDLKRMLELVPHASASPLAIAALYSDAAFFYVRYRRDPARAAALLPATEVLQRMPAKSRLHAEAAIALAAGNAEAAAAAAKRYLTLPSPGLVPPTLSQVQREEVERLRDEAISALTNERV